MFSQCGSQPFGAVSLPNLYSSHTVPKRGSPARILTISALSRVLPVGGQTSLAEANSEIAM